MHTIAGAAHSFDARLQLIQQLVQVQLRHPCRRPVPTHLRILQAARTKPPSPETILSAVKRAGDLPLRWGGWWSTGRAGSLVRHDRHGCDGVVQHGMDNRSQVGADRGAAHATSDDHE